MRLRRPPRVVARLLPDVRGVAALEFAMIAPVLILLFFGIAELGQGLVAERRVSHATASLGDLAAQNQTVNTAGANEMFAAAGDVMSPLTTTPLKLRISSVTGDQNGNPKVDWSYGSGGFTGYSQGSSPPTLPAGLVTAQGETLILSESQYQFTSPIGYVLPNGIAFTDSAYLRPRYGTVTKTLP